MPKIANLNPEAQFREPAGAMTQALSYIAKKHCSAFGQAHA